MNGPLKLFGSIATAAAVLLLATNCGGGSGSSGSSANLSPATSSSSSTSHTPVAYATLTVREPSNFFTAKSGRSAAAQKRAPAYLNAGGYYLAIWNATPYSSPTLVTPIIALPASTTLQIPLYSTDQNDFVAIEYGTDPTVGSATILAIGEADITGFTAGAGSGFTTDNSTPLPGGGPSLALTMQMNAAYLGVMASANNSDDSATLDPGSYGTCTGSVYFFEADADDGAFGYLNSTVAGGVDVPTLASAVSYGIPPYGMGANTLTPLNATGLSIGYSVNTGTGNGTSYVNATVNAANPAAPLLLDAINQTGNYPGIDWLESSGTSNVWLPTKASAVTTIVGPMIVQLYNNGC